MIIASLASLMLGVLACQQGDKTKLDPKTEVAAKAAVAAGSGSAPAGGSAHDDAIDLDSKDILARAPADKVSVKHVLISWKGLADAYRGHQDPRGAGRTNAEAAALARQIADKLRANPASIDDLAKESSEDPGSAKSGEAYEVKPDSKYVPEFKQLALRLQPNETGIVRTQFGYHVMMRVAPPPPDPLESSDILSRPAKPGTVFINHLLIGWKDTAHQSPDTKASTRSKQDADKMVQDVLTKAKAGTDFNKLIKEYSGEPDANDEKQEPVQLEADTPILDSFKDLAFRLQVDEIGAIKTPIGWLVMRRVAPPPPDPLESTDILKRDVQTQKAKVKHILLGWKGHSKDPRGEKRERAALEQLVKDTLAKLKSGTKIETLMSSLSEDPGSAATGKAYDVTPDASLVTPFKDLSLRLKVGEVGVVRTDFGIHIIQRVE
jgi:parvulin-like peptidyl-prolyl isomerase